MEEESRRVINAGKYLCNVIVYVAIYVVTGIWQYAHTCMVISVLCM